MKQYQLFAIGNALVDMELKVEESFPDADRLASLLSTKVVQSFGPLPLKEAHAEIPAEVFSAQHATLSAI